MGSDTSHGDRPQLRRQPSAEPPDLATRNTPTDYRSAEDAAIPQYWWGISLRHGALHSRQTRLCSINKRVAWSGLRRSAPPPGGGRCTTAEPSWLQRRPSGCASARSWAARLAPRAGPCRHPSTRALWLPRARPTCTRSTSPPTQRPARAAPAPRPAATTSSSTPATTGCWRSIGSATPSTGRSAGCRAMIPGRQPAGQPAGAGQRRPGGGVRPRHRRRLRRRHRQQPGARLHLLQHLRVQLPHPVRRQGDRQRHVQPGLRGGRRPGSSLGLRHRRHARSDREVLDRDRRTPELHLPDLVRRRHPQPAPPGRGGAQRRRLRDQPAAQQEAQLLLRLQRAPEPWSSASASPAPATAISPTIRAESPSARMAAPSSPPIRAETGSRRSPSPRAAATTPRPPGPTPSPTPAGRAGSPSSAFAA